MADDDKPQSRGVKMRDILEAEQLLRDDPETEIPADIRQAMDRLSQVAAPLLARQAHISGVFSKAALGTDIARLAKLGQSFGGQAKAAQEARVAAMTKMPEIKHLERRPITIPPNPAIEMSRHTAEMVETLDRMAAYLGAADERSSAAVEFAVASEERAVAAETREIEQVRLARRNFYVAVFALLATLVGLVLTAVLG